MSIVKLKKTLGDGTKPNHRRSHHIISVYDTAMIVKYAVIFRCSTVFSYFVKLKLRQET